MDLYTTRGFLWRFHPTGKEKQLPLIAFWCYIDETILFWCYIDETVLCLQLHACLKVVYICKMTLHLWQKPSNSLMPTANCWCDIIGQHDFKLPLLYHSDTTQRSLPNFMPSLQSTMKRASNRHGQLSKMVGLSSTAGDSANTHFSRFSSPWENPATVDNGPIVKNKCCAVTYSIMSKNRNRF